MKNIDQILCYSLIWIAALAAAISVLFINCGNMHTGDMSSPNSSMDAGAGIEESDWVKTEWEKPPPAPGCSYVFFDSGDYSYSVIKHQIIVNGNKAADPLVAPEKIIPGLYRGDSGKSTFLGWYNGDDKWDFANNAVTRDVFLSARWDDPPRVNMAAMPGNNSIERTIAYVKAKPDPAGYTLYLGANAVIKPQNIKVDKFRLKIQGIFQERTISFSGGTNGALFVLGAWKSGDPANLKSGMEFTLGENITLKGIKDNYSALVVVGDLVTFTMLPDSKITGNEIDDIQKAAGVELAAGQRGLFLMKGGEITGNKNHYSGVIAETPSAVLVPITSSFSMEGGSITGNIGGAGDVLFYASYSSPEFDEKKALLSGYSTIGRIALALPDNSLHHYQKLRINIPPIWNPKEIIELGLSGNMSMADVKEWFLEKGPQLLELEPSPNPSAVSMFKLGWFYSNDASYDGAIPSEYSLSDEGKLVLK